MRNRALLNSCKTVSIYRTSNLPVLQQRAGSKLPILDCAMWACRSRLGAVTSDVAIVKKPDALKRYLTAVESRP